MLEWTPSDIEASPESDRSLGLSYKSGMDCGHWGLMFCLFTFLEVAECDVARYSWASLYYLSDDALGAPVFSSVQQEC